jgi:hypothetical protein
VVQRVGAKKKAKVDSDQPLAIPIDIDNEEAALLGAMLVRLPQQTHVFDVASCCITLNFAPFLFHPLLDPL